MGHQPSPAESRGAAITAAAKPVLALWSRTLAAKGRPDGLLPRRFIDAYVMQGILGALFAGGRGDDLLLKGANSWSAWTSESGLPTFAAQVAGAVGDADIELLLRAAPCGDAIATRATKDIDLQLRGWARPDDFVAYFRDVIGSDDFRRQTGIVIDVENCVAAPRQNIAGVGVALRGEAMVGTAKSKWRVEAFISPFPEPGIGMMNGAIAPMMASVAEHSVVERLRHAGWHTDEVRGWLAEPGHLQHKVTNLVDMLSSQGDRKNADWLRANVLERWGALVAPIHVQVVTPEFMLAEKLTAMWDDGSTMSGLKNLRYKDYYDAEVMLTLGTDPEARAGFLPPLNRDIEISPDRFRQCFRLAFQVRGFEGPPEAVEGLAGLSDDYADVINTDGRTNAECYETADFRGRPFDPGRDRGLREVLGFLRDHVNGILPRNGCLVAGASRGHQANCIGPRAL